MNKCPQCGRYAADGFDGEGPYTPGLPCSNCGHREPLDLLQDGASSLIRCGTCGGAIPEGGEGFPEICPSCMRAEAPPAHIPEEPRGVLLHLVPPAPAGSSIEQQRSNCRKILLEALTRIENGEVDELLLATVNSKQSTSPYTLRWQFVDPIRMTGLLWFAQVKLASPPFVTMT